MAIPTYTREQLITLISTKLADQSTITAVEHRDVETAIINAIYGQIGDIKEIACDSTYITNNFKTGIGLIDEGLGLSTGERYGWAICNGKNGTINKMGRVAIGYDPANYPITTAGSNVGGAKDVTLSAAQIAAHNHEYVDAYFAEVNGSKPAGNVGGSGDSDGDNGFYYRTRTGLGSATLPPTGSLPLTSNNVGGQAHNNMQPYVVTLFIQRIPV